MASRRYLPTALPALAEAHASGSVPFPATVVVVASDDSEDAEYEALLDAADASAGLVTGLPDGQRRRVVLVTESAADLVRLADVVAVHADAVDDTDPDEDLGWYGTQELGDLLTHLG